MPRTPDIDSAFELSLKLSRLSVADEKRAQLSCDLGRILAYVDSIESVDTSQAQPLVSPLEVAGAPVAPLRADRAQTQPPLTGQYPDQERDDVSGLYIVPRILNPDD